MQQNWVSKVFWVGVILLTHREQVVSRDARTKPTPLHDGLFLIFSRNVASSSSSHEIQIYGRVKCSGQPCGWDRTEQKNVVDSMYIQSSYIEGHLLVY